MCINVDTVKENFYGEHKGKKSLGALKIVIEFEILKILWASVGRKNIYEKNYSSVSWLN